MAERAALVLVMGATVAIYAHSLTGGSVYEDLTRPVSAAFGSRWISRALAAGTQAVSMAPIAARLVSLALHLLNGLLIYRLGRRVLPVGAAVFGLALFLWHPLNTEAVGYAANQPELLVALFTLLALVLVDGSAVAAWACCAAAVLAKEPGIAAFLIVPALQAARGRWLWRSCAVWLLAGMGPALACWPMVAHHGFGVPSTHAIAINLAATGWLLTKFAWPVGLTVMPDWWWLTASAVGAVLAAWMTVFALGAWRPVLTVGASIVLLTVLPRLFWPLPGGLHEHHLYLASALLSMGVAAWLCHGRTIDADV